MKSLLVTLFSSLISLSISAATISGTVIGENNQPLASMTVAAYTTTGVLAVSGTSIGTGTYALTLPAGSYHLLAYDAAGAYATSFYAEAESFETSATIGVGSSQNVTNINFRLVRAGFVVGDVSIGTIPSNPARGITVAAYNPSGTRRGFATTDSAGLFTLALPPGTYKIAAYDDTLTYAGTFFVSARTFDAASPLTVVAGTSVTARLAVMLAARIAGVVRDRTTAVPLAGVRVTVYDNNGEIAARTFTGADGRYAVAVFPGPVRVVVDDPAGNYATNYVPDEEAFSVEPAVGAVVSQTLTLDVTLARAGRLVGRVTDRVSGAPLGGLTVTAYNPDGTIRSFTTSDASGNYLLIVPGGTFRIGVSDSTLIYPSQFYANERSFAAAPSVNATVQQTVSGLDFALPKGARARGRVTSRSTGASLSGITIGAYDTSGRLLESTTTDASGAYTLVMAPGTVRLLAFDRALQFAAGYYLGAPTFAATVAVTVAQGQSLTADFVLPDAGRITGSVVNGATSAPLVGITVLVYDSNSQTIAESTTDSSGSFRIAVPAGAYIVAFGDPSRRFAPAVYGGGAGSLVTVTARQETGPLQVRLSVPAVVIRRRVAAH